jgi:S-adenosylmethionine-dependent methyltransferase
MLVIIWMEVSPVKDVSFDHLFEKFQSKIYGSRKGIIRQAVMEGFIADQLAGEAIPLRVADIGGGLGQYSLLLAQQGHAVTYCDASAKMCAHVQTQITQQGLAPFPIVEGRFQTEMQGQQFDFVLCHAVLEWLEDPVDGLRQLAKMVAPNGQLVVVFYNVRAIQFRNLIKGNWRAALLPYLSGGRNSLTPISPIDPDTFAAALADLGGHIVDKMGVRTFSEYVYPGRTDKHTDADFIAMERAVARKEPYLSMARYIAWAIRF